MDEATEKDIETAGKEFADDIRKGGGVHAVAKAILCIIAASEQQGGPELAERVFVRDIIGQVVDTIPDEVWDGMERASGTPCGKDRCDCHLISQELFTALDKFRTAIKK